PSDSRSISRNSGWESRFTLSWNAFHTPAVRNPSTADKRALFEHPGLARDVPPLGWLVLYEREAPLPEERAMTSERRQSFGPAASKQSPADPLQGCVDTAIQNLLASFPNPEQLSPEERRGTIARYTAVLEGNFIYWMTAAYLPVASEDARSIIHDNLLEEVRDNHPGMLRRFAMAARAVPTDSDALAVHRSLQNVRF